MAKYEFTNYFRYLNFIKQYHPNTNLIVSLHYLSDKFSLCLLKSISPI